MILWTTGQSPSCGMYEEEVGGGCGSFLIFRFNFFCHPFEDDNDGLLQPNQCHPERM